MNSSRRHFLELLAGTAAMGMMPPPAVFGQSGKRTLVMGIEPNLACIVDLNSLNAKCFRIGFPAHSFVSVPHELNLVWGIEKWGRHAAEIDIRQGEVLRRIDSPEGTQFYGHGVFWKKKNLLLISRVDIAKSEGQLAGYDYATLKQVASFVATPGALHECHLVSDDTALVTNGGLGTGVQYAPRQGPRVGRSGLVKIDLSANNILTKMSIEDDEQSIGHFLRLGDGTIVGLSVDRPGAVTKHGYVYFAKPGGDLQKLPLESSLERRLRGQLLSAAVNEQNGIVAITNPESRTVLFVDARQGKIAGYIEQEGMGIVYDPAFGLVSFGTTLTKIDPNSHAVKTLPWQLKRSPGSMRVVSHSLLV